MTQMIFHPAPARLRHRAPASIAIYVALAVRLLPARFRTRVRMRLATSTRRLPAAAPDRVRHLYEAVIACQPTWWRGQIDCKERSLATVLATALTGRRCHLVMGARTLPASYHAWVVTTDGTHMGAEEGGGQDHPWTPVYISP